MRRVTAPKYSLAAVATDSKVQVFAAPYLADTPTELFPVLAAYRYAVLVDTEGVHRVVAVQELTWLTEPDWRNMTPGVVSHRDIAASERFATIDQAVTYIGSILHGTEVIYFTKKQSAYVVQKIEAMPRIYKVSYTSRRIREIIDSIPFIYEIIDSIFIYERGTDK